MRGGPQGLVEAAGEEGSPTAGATGEGRRGGLRPWPCSRLWWLRDGPRCGEKCRIRHRAAGPSCGGRTVRAGRLRCLESCFPHCSSRAARNGGRRCGYSDGSGGRRLRRGDWSWGAMAIGRDAKPSGPCRRRCRERIARRASTRRLPAWLAGREEPGGDRGRGGGLRGRGRRRWAGPRESMGCGCPGVPSGGAWRGWRSMTVRSP